MNERKLIQIMKSISKRVGGEFTSSLKNIPLVSISEYGIVNCKTKLSVEVRVAANTSVLRKNISLNFYTPDISSEKFTIKDKRFIFSFLIKALNYEMNGANSLIASYMLNALKEKGLEGVRSLEIDGNKTSLSIKLKTLYQESCYSTLELISEVLTKFGKKK